MAVFICSKLGSLQSQEMVKVDLPTWSPNTTVETLFSLVKNKLELQQSGQEFELICFGKSLKPDKPLAHYGIKNGTIVYVFKKRDMSFGSSDKAESAATVCKWQKEAMPRNSEQEINRTGMTLRTTIADSNFKNMLEKLHDKDFRENLLACTPGLRDDPVALAILQDVELLAICTEQENFAKVLEKHPSLCDALTHLAAAFHEDRITSQSSSSTPAAPGSVPPPVHGYSMDFSDDDEEMEGTPQEQQQEMQRRLTELYRREAANQRQRQAVTQRPAALTHPNGTGMITQLMLESALSSLNPPQRTVPTPASSSTTPARSLPTNTPQRDWSVQMQQIREVTGIEDEDLRRNALDATNGDVQAALNIILQL